METMATWYGLKDGRKDFTVENEGDAKLLFARATLDEQLQAILRKSFRTGNPPKMVLYGDWGVGKTHTLRHIEYVIAANTEYRAQCVFIELPDITARSTFEVAHAALLDALGLERTKTWMIQYQTKYQSRAREFIQKETQSEDISRAFASLIGYGDSARMCWDWLRGVNLSSTDARSVGLPPSLDQSNQLVSVLRMLGRLSSDIEDKLLILMIDEAIKLADVTNGDAIAHWRNAFKILSDRETKELGFIVSATFNDPEDMPRMLQDQQIRSRFGPDHYILLNNFGPEEANEFTCGLVQNWVDASRRDALLAEFAQEIENEPILDTSFPFTAPALQVFVDYACRNGGITNPRDLQSSLDTVLNRAIDDGRHILSLGYINGIMAAV
jgi:Cdc6-like AAA superfamily ATPase